MTALIALNSVVSSFIGRVASLAFRLVLRGGKVGISELAVDAMKTLTLRQLIEHVYDM